MENIKIILAQKLVRPNKGNIKSFNEYRGAGYSAETSSTKLLTLLEQEKYEDITNMILEDKIIDDINVTSLWDSIYDCYSVDECCPIGQFTVKKLTWLHDHGMAPNENQKCMLIPFICYDRNNYTNYLIENYVESIRYLHSNGYNTFNQNEIFNYFYNCDGYNNKHEIVETTNEMFNKTVTFIDKYLLLEKKKTKNNNSYI
jgi:hypothetical protein